MDGAKLTNTEKRTLEYIMSNYRMDTAAKTLLEERLTTYCLKSCPSHGAILYLVLVVMAAAVTCLAAMPSQYKQIQNVRYERDLLDIADATQAAGRTMLEADAEKLWTQAIDGGKLTDTEEHTVKYIMSNYRMNTAAKTLLEKRLSWTSASRTAKRYPWTSASPTAKRNLLLLVIAGAICSAGLVALSSSTKA